MSITVARTRRCSTIVRDITKFGPRKFVKSAHLFRIGGFGENLVAQRANERSTCIGDIVRFGRDVEAQVSLPRQPCYKLNHRFQEKNMSRLAQERFRTGRYYRIIQKGTIQAGDEILLLERLNPE